MRIGGFVALGFVSFGAVIANCSSVPTNLGGYDAGAGGGSSGGPGSSSGSQGSSSGTQGSSSGTQGGSSSGTQGGSSSGTQGGSSSGLGGSSGTATGAITLDDTTCTWVGGLAPTNIVPTANTAVLGATASSANKLNPTCQICSTTDCPNYTNPATVPTPGDFDGGTYAFPNIGFDPTYDLGATANQPVYIPNDVIIPTLDDAPDGADTNGGPGSNDGYTPGEWTITDLAFLDSIGEHWDFFLNSNNWAPVTANPGDGTCDADGYNAYVDILKNHFPANHTQDHVQMGGDFQGDTACTIAGGTESACCDCDLCKNVDCTAQLASIETLVAAISNNGRPHLTRFRYPYGYPMESPPVFSELAVVQPKVAKFAVSVGWHFLTDDADNSPCGCQETSGTTCTCIDEEKGGVCSDDVAPLGPYDNVTADYNNFVNAIKAGPGKGSWGVALMHAVLPWTAGTIRKLFGPGGYMSTSPYRIGTVEDAICWKYGMHSWEVVNKFNGYTGTNARGPN